MAWSRLQSASASAESTSTVSATLGSNCVAGSTLIAAISGDSIGSSGTVSVEDSEGDSFYEIAKATQFGGTRELSLWALNTPGMSSAPSR